MDQLTQRRNEVRALRAGLAKSLQEVRRRLKPPELVEDALAMLDPERRFLGRVQSGIKRNPLIAAILLAGAGWLIADAPNDNGKSNRASSRRPRKASKPTINHKGDYHDAQHHNRDQWPNASTGEARPPP